MQRKISQIRSADGGDVGMMRAGDVAVVYGLGDLKTGYIFGNPEKLPPESAARLAKTPLLMIRVIPDKPEETQALWEACAVLSSEDPLLQAEYVRTTGEIRLQIMGKVQLEILRETLASRFGLQASFGEAAVIYRETIRTKATGFAAYTMPKPCWAVLEFELEPAPRGSGVSYASVVPGKDIMPRYQHQVEQALPRALSQGRQGKPEHRPARVPGMPGGSGAYHAQTRGGSLDTARYILAAGARSRGKSTDREPRF